MNSEETSGTPKTARNGIPKVAGNLDAFFSRLDIYLVKEARVEIFVLSLIFFFFTKQLFKKSNFLYFFKYITVYTNLNTI